MKVINLTTGGLTDVWMVFFSEARSKACCEKSAEVIVDTDTSLPVKKNVPQEVLPGIEGLNLILSE